METGLGKGKVTLFEEREYLQAASRVALSYTSKCFVRIRNETNKYPADGNW